jgi:hypothetical protein
VGELETAREWERTWKLSSRKQPEVFLVISNAFVRSSGYVRRIADYVRTK